MMTELADYRRRLLDETREEVSRADTKASIVLAGSGVVVGILLTSVISGDLALEGKPCLVKTLVLSSAVLLALGLGCLGSAVYPRTKGAVPGRARWFGEIVQYKDDFDALKVAVDFDLDDGDRDLQQVQAIAAIVDRKFRLTRIGMWFLAGGFVVSGLAGIAAAVMD